MPCRHRFYNNLLPNRNGIEFLIIGTFNPEWNAVNGNNADYFYGRASSLFWCICPHAFNNNCLIDKGPNEWVSFCNDNNIGLTDIIKEVANADINEPEHIDLLTVGFQDKNLDVRNNGNYFFELEFNTNNIIQFITNRQKELKGVFFTRISNAGIPRIWGQWAQIREHCNQLGIYNSALPTPSTRGGNIRDKIFTWKQEIQNCM